MSLSNHIKKIVTKTANTSLHKKMAFMIRMVGGVRSSSAFFSSGWGVVDILFPLFYVLKFLMDFNNSKYDIFNFLLVIPAIVSFVIREVLDVILSFSLSPIVSLIHVLTLPFKNDKKVDVEVMAINKQFPHARIIGMSLRERFIDVWKKVYGGWYWNSPVGLFDIVFPFLCAAGVLMELTSTKNDLRILLVGIPLMIFYFITRPIFSFIVCILASPLVVFSHVMTRSSRNKYTKVIDTAECTDVAENKLTIGQTNKDFKCGVFPENSTFTWNDGFPSMTAHTIYMFVTDTNNRYYRLLITQDNFLEMKPLLHAMHSVNFCGVNNDPLFLQIIHLFENKIQFQCALEERRLEESKAPGVKVFGSINKYLVNMQKEPTILANIYLMLGIASEKQREAAEKAFPRGVTQDKIVVVDEVKEEYKADESVVLSDAEDSLHSPLFRP